MKPETDRLERLYRELYSAFGPQHWWPGDTPFEVAVGAILTQNTNWGNVERAIANLKAARALTARVLYAMPASEVAALIRPAGYFNVKARRLKAFLRLLVEDFGSSMEEMKRLELPALRRELLAVNGIGPETADSILLYALEKPAFVIDAYTKRVLSRHGIMGHNRSYDEFQSLFHQSLRRDIKLFNEYHALLVAVGKHYCKSKPRCTSCPLRSLLPERPAL